MKDHFENMSGGQRLFAFMMILVLTVVTLFLLSGDKIAAIIVSLFWSVILFVTKAIWLPEGYGKILIRKLSLTIAIATIVSFGFWQELVGNFIKSIIEKLFPEIAPKYPIGEISPIIALAFMLLVIWIVNYFDRDVSAMGKHPNFIDKVTKMDREKSKKDTFVTTGESTTHASIPEVEDETRKLKIFLCHSSEDKEKVRKLYHQLREDGFNPWLDEEKLLPGQDWDLEIRKAVRDAHIFIVCLSKITISKRGYVQKEIARALDLADEQPEGTIFLIPAKLETCEIPDRLSRWQWVSLFEENGYSRLKEALRISTSQI